MNFILVEKQVSALERDEISDRQARKYYFAYFLLWLLAVAGSFSEGFEVESVAWIGISLLALAVDASYCYFLNRQGDRRNFLKRYLCLSFPLEVCVKLITMGIVLVVLLVFFALNRIALLLSVGETVPVSLGILMALVTRVVILLWKRSCFLRISKKS